MWRAGDDADGAWRSSLENAQTGERETFAEVEDLLAFLRRQTNDPPRGREEQ
jgi:hypothetical protein